MVFLGPNGPWDLFIFGSVEEAKSYAEPPDVLAGEYGENGWDADGKLVALVALPSSNPLGPIGRLLGLQPPLEVHVKELAAPAEPDSLRNALIGRLAGLEPQMVTAAECMALDDLIIFVRGAIDERIKQIRSGRYSSRSG